MRTPPCCVPGCEAEAPHKRTFTIAAEGWGEIETETRFCCGHLDLLAADVPPVLDLKVHGEVRSE